MYTVEAGFPINLAASAVICAKPCTILGFYVNSTSSGTMNILDGGSSGTALCGTITPAAGAFHRFPATTSTAAYFTIVSGSLNVTFFYQPL
jgi:hypothetical protein